MSQPDFQTESARVELEPCERVDGDGIGNNGANVADDRARAWRVHL
jgi:hypothetical protein